MPIDLTNIADSVAADNLKTVANAPAWAAGMHTINTTHAYQMTQSIMNTYLGNHTRLMTEMDPSQAISISRATQPAGDVANQLAMLSTMAAYAGASPPRTGATAPAPAG